MNYLESRADELEDSWYSDMLTLDKQVLNALRVEDGERAKRSSPSGSGRS